MIIIDTSVWIPFFRSAGDQKLKIRVGNLILSKEAAYTCPIYFELISGARNEEAEAVKTGLSYARRISLEMHHWDSVAEINRDLRSRGLTIPAMDLLIAVVAMDFNVSVLTTDNHFQVIREQVFSELDLVN